jgi:GT2 family glycosyltransferase
MIPTFNCAQYLRETLESVLVQDLGTDQMQIDVVDDCSTKDDPEIVVAEVGRRRVGFKRNSRNIGVTANFNRCIELANGRLIHILHGDDFVLPNFYNTIGRMAEQNPNCSFFATRTIATDEKRIPEWISTRTKSLEVPSKDVSEVVMCQRFQTASVVVRRSFYERHGGFDTELCHCADWEMWVRAIRLGGGLVHPEPLAQYRMSEHNDTSRLKRTGENVLDSLRVAERFAQLPGFKERKFARKCAKDALTQARTFSRIGDAEAAEANLRIHRLLTEPQRKSPVRFALAKGGRAIKLTLRTLAIMVKNRRFGRGILGPKLSGTSSKDVGTRAPR